MATIRSFLGIPVCDPTRENLSAILNQLRSSHAVVRWEAPSKFHLTMKFLGDVEVETLEHLADALTAEAKSISTFDLALNTVGAFPSVLEPKIVWAGGPLSAEIRSLVEVVESIAAQHGLPRETRPFHNHITLGRVKSRENLSRLTEALKSSTLEPIPMRCKQLVLYKSVLQPGGSVYSIIRSIPFLV